MSSDGPWIRFFASDWLAGTRGLSVSETGVYITLVALMYEHNEPINRDEPRLARQCGLPVATFRTILQSLIDDGKVTLVDGKLWGRKVGLEVDYRKSRSEKARDAAKAKHQINQRQYPANAYAKQSSSSATRAPDQISEPDIDNSLRSLSVAAAPKRAKGTRLPDDWSLPNEWGKWAQDDLGLDAKFIRQQTAVFRDYWIAKAGANATKLDWQATWRNWMRKAAQDRPRDRGGSARQPSMLELNAQLLAEMEDADARRQADHPSLEPPAGHLPDIRKR